MDVDFALIEKVAFVSKLNLSVKEKNLFIDDFKNILKAFSDIDDVNTKNVVPAIQPIDFVSNLRSDDVKVSISQDQALSNTVHKKDGYFKGPRAI